VSLDVRAATHGQVVHRPDRLSTTAGRRLFPGSKERNRAPVRALSATPRSCNRPTRAEQQRRQPAGTDLVAAPDLLADLADRQAGVTTREQLAVLGVSTAAIATAVRAGRWRALGRRVVVLHNSSLTSDQRQWAAVLFPAKPTALAGLSAAAACGLQGFEPDKVHIVVAHDTRTNLPSWVKVHESRRFTASDIVVASPPRTSAARGLVDAAAWSRWPRRACVLLCAGVQQRLATVTQLSDELDAAGQIRHAAIMRSVLGDIGGGGHTLAEIEFGPLAARAGLPPPQRQRLRADVDGKIRYLDVELELPDRTLLVVEIDGRGHIEVTKWTDDLDRQNEVVIDGHPVLRFPSLIVRLNPDRVVDQLSRMRLAHPA
jgi:hypothetical protein